MNSNELAKTIEAMRESLPTGNPEPVVVVTPLVEKVITRFGLRYLEKKYGVRFCLDPAVPPEMAYMMSREQFEQIYET